MSGGWSGVRTAYLVATVAAVGFFALSVTLLGVWPARILDAQTRAMGPEHPLRPTTAEQRGRLIYGREGCAYCHTQQIRYLQTDMARFGAPTLAWETQFDAPHLWGTRRIGPDLSRAGGARSRDWHYAHLFAPRTIVAGSVMPAYPALFDGAPDQPRQPARDLVAYLESLGRARELAAPEGDVQAREGCQCPDDAIAQLAFVGALNTHPGRARREVGAPHLPAGDLDRGEQLYAQHCATCHGAGGDGGGPGAAGLLPKPANLNAHEYTTERLAEVLWNGVAGSAMPAWRDHDGDDLASLALAVQTRSTVPPEPARLDDPPTLGARVYGDHCVQCHGVRGDGRGPAAAALAMDPASFIGQRIDRAEAMRVLRSGVAGTPMAPWNRRLSEDELVAVASYVRRFYVATGPGAARR